MAETLYASFADPDMAEKAVGALLDHGVRSEDISLVSNETWGRSRYGDTLLNDNVATYGEAAGYSDDDDDGDPVAAGKHGISTTTGGDAASGALKGAGIGLGLGTAAALATLFIPGVGLVTGGGALATAIGAALGTSAAGAAAGAATGYLKDQGVPDEAIGHYTSAIERGGAMLAIQLPSSDDVDRTEVEQVLAKYGATNVGTYAGPMV